MADKIAVFPAFAVAELAPLLAELDAAGVEAARLERVEYGAPDLEQIFMQLTHHSLRN